MMKSRNPKNPEQRYFDLDEISVVDRQGESFADLIYAYAEYVVYRLRNISGKYGLGLPVNSSVHELQGGGTEGARLGDYRKACIVCSQEGQAMCYLGVR